MKEIKKKNKNSLIDLVRVAKEDIKLAFINEPLIVNKSVADKVSDDFFFIPIDMYAEKYVSKLIKGEIGVFNKRRIIINLPVNSL